MSDVYEIPLTPATPQNIVMDFPNGRTYRLRLIYQWTPEHCWLLDVADSAGAPILCGVPIVSGADLFAQFAYLDFGCSLYCTVDGDLFAIPRFDTLGRSAKLWLST